MVATEIKVDGEQVVVMIKALDAAGRDVRPAIRRAFKQSFRHGRAVLARLLVPATGLKSGTIKRAIVQVPNDENLIFKTRGGDIRIKYLRARQNKKGATAYPFGRKTFYPSAFRIREKGVVSVNDSLEVVRTPGGFKRDGHFFQRVGKKKYGIKAVRSGVIIPEVMLSGVVSGPYFQEVAVYTQKRLLKELERSIMGYAK